MHNPKPTHVLVILTCLALLALPATVLAQDEEPAEESDAAADAVAKAEAAQKEAEEAKAAAEEAIKQAEAATQAAQDAVKAIEESQAKAEEAEAKEAEAKKKENKLDKIFSRSKDHAPNSDPDKKGKGSYFGYRPVQGIAHGTLGLDNGLQWPYFTRSTIGISGDVWADGSFRKGESSKEGEPKEKEARFQGRGVLRVTPTWVGKKNWFIQGELELVADKDQSKDISQSSDTDAVWVKFGQWGKKYNNWDLQAGRYQAWSLFHLGMGLDLNTLERRGAIVGSTNPPEFYGVTYMWDYPTSDLGNLAVHYYPTNWLRVEGLFQSGYDPINSLGGRGAIVFDWGFVKVKGGGEYKQKTPKLEGNKNDEVYWGAGGALQFVFDPFVEFGGHYAYGSQKIVKFDGGKNLDATFDHWSVGGFLNVSPLATFSGEAKNLMLGGGFDYTSKWDAKEDEDGYVGVFSHLQAFGAIQYKLFGQLEIKALMAYALADMAPSFADSTGIYDAKMLSWRLRLRYYF